MKFALNNGERVEPTKGGKANCPSCGADLIAKCGNIKVHHWAHKGIRTCDPWWENETQWHRQWKGNFPVEWQEKIHFDASGEKHIADVKTAENWVLEFQHSAIKPDERRARNAFYSKIVWIVDGVRRESDKSQFQHVLEGSRTVKWGNVLLYRVGFTEESRLLKEWLNPDVPVFFDFQESTDVNHKRVWFLIPTSLKGVAYLIPFSGTNFIELHNSKGFDEMAFEIIPKLRSFILGHEKNRNQVRFNLVRPSNRRF
jgi:competence protein CoiA